MLILLIEDEIKLQKLISLFLHKEGFSVINAMGYKEGLDYVSKITPDVIILDIMLGDGSGFTLLQKIRQRSEVPVILLSAKSEEKDKITGFNLGTDDYVTKPFSMKELMARVKALFARSRPKVPNLQSSIAIGDIIIDIPKRSVFKAQKPLHLTKLQFDLLVLLFKNPGVIYTREMLIDLLLQDASGVFDRTVDAHVKNLRKIIGDNAALPRYIKTIRGVGYQCIAGENNETG